VFLFNTIVNAGSVSNAVCMGYAWAWAWTSLIAANNACYHWPHFGAYNTGEGSTYGAQVFDASSKNNVTDTASPDSGTGVPSGDSGNTAGTVMTVPNSTYNASGAAMFVSPGSDWRPGSALVGAGASYGTFNWGCESSGPCVTIPVNKDTPDFLGVTRPHNGHYTVGPESEP
jgi:hypothetical protein